MRFVKLKVQKSFYLLHNLSQLSQIFAEFLPILTKSMHPVSGNPHGQANNSSAVRSLHQAAAPEDISAFHFSVPLYG